MALWTLTFLLAAAQAGAPASADVSSPGLVVVSRLRNLAGAETTVSEYFTAERARLSDGDREAILELGTGRIVVVENAKGEYWETSLEELAKFRERVRSRMTELADRLPQSHIRPSGGLRDRILGEPASGSLIRGEAAPRPIAGYACTLYTYESHTARAELWTTAAIDARAVDARRAFLLPGDSDTLALERIYDELKRLKAYPLDWSAQVPSGSIQVSATSASAASLPPATFLPPEGYTRIESLYGRIMTAIPRPQPLPSP